MHTAAGDALLSQDPRNPMNVMRHQTKEHDRQQNRAEKNDTRKTSTALLANGEVTASKKRKKDDQQTAKDGKKR